MATKLLQPLMRYEKELGPGQYEPNQTKQWNADVSNSFVTQDLKFDVLWN